MAARSLLLAEMVLAVGLVLSWLVPNHYNPWVSFHSEWLIFASLLVAAAASLCAKDIHANTLRTPVVAIFPIFLLACLCSQYLFGFRYWFGDFLIFTAYVLSVITAVSLVNITTTSSDRWLCLLASCLVFAAVISTAVGLLQVLAPNLEHLLLIPIAPNTWRAAANIGQSNHFGILCVMAIASLLYLHSRWRFSAAIGIAIGLWLSYGIAFSGSRTAILAMFVSVLFLVWKGIRLPIRHAAVSASIVMLAVVFAVLTHDDIIFSIRGEMPSSLQSTGSIYSRQQIWQLLWHAAWSKPLTGYGFFGVGAAQNEWAGLLKTQENWHYAHNFVLELMISLGAMLGLAVAAAVAGVFVFVAFAARSKVAVFSSAIALPVLVHSCFEYPYAYGYFLIPASLCLGLAWREISGFMIRVNLKTARIIVVVAMGMFCYGSYEYFIAEENHRVLRFEVARIGMKPVEHVDPNYVFWTQLGEFARIAKDLPKGKLSKQQIELERRIAERFVYPGVLFRYIVILAKNNEIQSARRQLDAFKVIHSKTSIEAIKELCALSEGKHPELRAVLGDLSSTGCEPLAKPINK
jgi:O-antigen ligase